MDTKNALGEARRADVFPHIIKKVPQLAPIAGQLWRGSSSLWVETNLGIWGSVEVCDGLYQGEC
eukprot:4661423-Alexandrium_andersonii.AAC.1